jgi:hypothetical protein
MKVAHGHFVPNFFLPRHTVFIPVTTAASSYEFRPLVRPCSSKHCKHTKNGLMTTPFCILFLPTEPRTKWWPKAYSSEGRSEIVTFTKTAWHCTWKYFIWILLQLPCELDCQILWPIHDKQKSNSVLETAPLNMTKECTLYIDVKSLIKYTSRKLTLEVLHREVMDLSHQQN